MSSTRVLIEEVTKALEAELAEGQTLEGAGIRIPTESYVNFQFAPKNMYARSALEYTGTLFIELHMPTYVVQYLRVLIVPHCSCQQGASR